MRTTKRNRRAFFNPKRIAGVGCLIIVLILLGASAFLYTRIRSAFETATGGVIGGPNVDTQDVVVERGDIVETVTVFGQVQPLRTETLAFRFASERILAVHAMPGLLVEEGQPLVELDRAALERNLATARDKLQQAQDALEELSKPDPVREFELKAQLAEAKSNRAAAQRALDAFDAGQGTPQAQRAEALAALNDARAKLNSLENSEAYQKQIEHLQWVYNIAEVEHGPYVTIQNPSEVDRDKEWLLRLDMLAREQDLENAKLAHDMEVRAARLQVVQAERALAKLDQEIALGSPAVERAKLVASIQTLDAAIIGLEEQLATLDGETDPVELAQAEADILKAEYAVQQAEVALAEATLVAPFAGTVIEVNAVADTVASTGTKMVTISDDSALQVIARLNELDVVRAEAGMPVTITFDAFGPETEIAGRVEEIPRYGKYENGMTLYDTTISFQSELPVRQGMSANIRIPQGVREDVLLLPVAAIQYGIDGPFVMIVEGDEVTNQPVELGVSDGINVEIIEGVSEGQTVRMMLWGPYRGGVYIG
jgi:HlyD family secretion protein